MDIGVYGLGRFGSFWAGCLASAGCNVKAYSRSEHPLPSGVERGTEDEVLSAPYLFFAVSISSFEDVLKRGVQSPIPMMTDTELSEASLSIWGWMFLR